ncbi:putative regulatory protein, FmdB family [Propionibacterium cyclohexanicum]|uniref:Putative regulatory protein, FmdB family n=1 Tax=Propionibacterium cyclohexanicum TaxID=64702 RepID=A0A1H9U3I5_9ACTN|nr:FmdB family zinc ribbon protein [Propionibacterium cyclohexanicum]SES04065.1 putative regulatory protein, FmdB family [Propionibacterium cyclohexanicum]
MPNYEYACTSCGEHLEVFQKFTDKALTVCPQCSGQLRKVFSPVGVVFKGSGFYATDNRTSGKTSAALPAASASSDSDSSSSAESSSSADSTPKADASATSTSTSTPEAKVA